MRIPNSECGLSTTSMGCQTAQHTTHIQRDHFARGFFRFDVHLKLDLCTVEVNAYNQQQ